MEPNILNLIILASCIHLPHKIHLNLILFRTKRWNVSQIGSRRNTWYCSNGEVKGAKDYDAIFFEKLSHNIPELDYTYMACEFGVLTGPKEEV